MRSLLLVLGFCSLGCGSPPVKLTINGAESASKCFAQYDANKDGQLDAKELEAVPSLKAALKSYDTNNDAKISQEELSTRLSAMVARGIGVMDIAFVITLDGRELVDAEVTLSPESFLSDALKVATGKTDKGGNVSPRPQGIEGLQFGLYRITISSKSGGREILPAKFNEKSTLGCEVAHDSRGDVIELRLKR